MWKAKLKEKHFINGQAIIVIEYQKGDDEKTAFSEKYNWADFPDDLKLGQLVHAQIERLTANESKIANLIIDKEIQPVAPSKSKTPTEIKSEEKVVKKQFSKIYNITYKYDDGSSKTVSVKEEDLKSSQDLADRFGEAHGRSLASADVKLIEVKHTTELVKL